MGKEAVLIDELTSIAQINDLSCFDHKPCFVFAIDGTDKISFYGIDNVRKYKKKIEQLYFFNKEISRSITLKKFAKEIFLLIRKLKNEKRKSTNDDFTKIINELLKIEIQEYDIFGEFYGAVMSTSNIQFCDFIIYEKEKLYDNFNNKFPYLKKYELDSFFKDFQSDLLIGIKIKTRDIDKVDEIAYKLFESFENVFNYVLADITHKTRVNILNSTGFASKNFIVFNNDSLKQGNENEIRLQINLNNTLYFDKAKGNDKIWQLITKKGKNEIELRLLNAIEWIGKAICDKDKEKSLLQYVFAIEGMLQFDKRAFITPSIASQIGDYLAFILYEDKESRKGISKYFKDIYQKRSAIAHGNHTNITIDDLSLALKTSKQMIIAFLTKSPYKEMTRMEELNDYIIDLKFK